MDKGQAHVAVILIITLAVIVGGVLVVVFVLNDQSTTPTSATDPWTSGATVPGATPGNIPTIPTTPTTPGTPSTGTGGIPGELCLDSFGDAGQYDCSGACVENNYLQGSLYDGYCDEGEFGVNLNCATFNYDETDCTSGSTGGTPSTPGTGGSSWCPAGVSQPFVVGGITGTGTVDGLVTYEGEEMCKATLATLEGTAYYYENQAGDHYYMTDSLGSLLVSWEFPMGIDSTGGSTGAWTWMFESGYTTISEGMLADFVNAKVVPESVAWETYPPECDLSATPFSADGGNVGLRTCNMDAEIADLGVMAIYDVWKLDSSTFNWVSNPTATVGHVYVIKARDGSQHRIEVTSISADYEEVTFSWESGV